MKRSIRWAGLMAEQDKNSDSRRERGSIALEAALVTPILLFVLLFLVVMIRLAAVQMALHDLVAQTVRQTAAHLYPAELALGTLSHQADQLAERLRLSSVEEAAAQLAPWLPAPAGEVLARIGEGDWRDVQGAAATAVGRAWIEPLVKEAASWTVLDPERVRIHRVALPDLPRKQSPYLTVTVEYVFPLNFPFTTKSLLLRERATERVWVSDAVRAPPASKQGETAHARLQLLAIEPAPLHPGHKARLRALTDPGRTVSLSVHYKSGTSKARYLGAAQADADGFVSWEWLVSGNTTPGMWEVEVTAGDGTTARMHFTVEKRSATGGNP